MAQATDPTSSIPASPKPPSRLGLYLPYLLLLAVALLWSAGWFWIRGRAAAEMDAWVAREAAAGRSWTCVDRSIAGFPFRLELRCSALRFARADGSFSLGPVTVVVQVYQPRHGILEAVGPFHVEQGDLVGDVNWTSLAASFQGASDGFVRASLVVDGPKGRVTGAEPGSIDFAVKHLELHARPTPGRFESEGAVDVSLRASQASLPQLDALVRNREPADIDLDMTIERATVLRTGRVAAELETWRRADGRLDVTRLSLVKGPQRVQAKGDVGLDAAHRPDGRFELRATGLEGLIGNLVGQLLGGLQRRRPGSEAGAADAQAADKPQADPVLKPLPALRLAGGRLMLGPIPVPNVVVPPLY